MRRSGARLPGLWVARSSACGSRVGVRTLASSATVTGEIQRLRKDVATTDEYIGLTGAQIFVECMKEHNVDHIFGYPGGAILPVFDAIYEVEDFKFILTRHEQGAGHMAQGYARVTGKPGIVLVTSGPGATNTITPMQDALMDGTPMVVFAGQVATGAIGTDAFQEADVMGISRPATKWCVQVKDVRELPRRIAEAFEVATSGRPGPVIVDLPKDVTAALCSEAVAKEPQLPGLRCIATPSSKGGAVQDSDQTREMMKAADMINGSKNPVIFAGQGVLQAGPEAVAELRLLSKEAQIPVTTSLQGLGAFDENEPLALHMLGMHGAAYANYAVQNSDCIIGVGVRFDDRVTGKLDTFAPAAKAASAAGTGGIIHFDILHKNVNKVVPADCAVVGDCEATLKTLRPMLKTERVAQRAPWLAQIEAWKRLHPFNYYPSKEGAHMKPQEVLEELQRQIAHRDDIIITTGVGQHQMFAAQFLRWHQPQSWVSSGGLGTMGFGVPSAIGAQLGQPGKTVIDVDGDGSFCMTAMEMATAAEYGVPVKILLLNNDFQGMVRQWQDLFFDKRYSGTEMKNPNFVALAEAMHCKGLKCETMDDLPAKMAEFLAHDGPIVGEFMVDKNEHTLPMVPAGHALDDMVLCPLPPK